MPLILTIDQSTSSTKVFLFDEQGRVIDECGRPHRQHYPQPGWVEHDAAEIWDNLLDATGELLGRPAARRPEIAGVSLTNQRETVVVFDDRTGEPLHRALVWQDRRGDPCCAAQAAAGRTEAIRERTGLRVDSYFSAPKLQWLVRERPDLRERLARGEARIGTIDAYLVKRLTGALATDATNASRTMLFGLGRGDWDPELSAWWDVPPAALPPVRDCTAIFGHTDLGGRLPRPVPVCGVIGDSQASLFGQRCFGLGEAKATFGTGTSILLNVGSTRPAGLRGGVAALAWRIDGRATYAAEGIVTASASTLTWLRDQLGLFRDTAEISALAAEAGPDSGGVHLVPAFSGLGAPHWSDGARAALTGLSAHSDRRHVARAALESIAFQVAEVLEMLRAETGVTPRLLHADGGATANAFVMQFTADLAGIPVHVADQPHHSALGAAFLGMLGLGIHPSPEALRALPHPAIVYQPALPAGAVRARVAGWRRAVQQVLAGASAPSP